MEEDHNINTYCNKIFTIQDDYYNSHHDYDDNPSSVGLNNNIASEELKEDKLQSLFDPNYQDKKDIDLKTFLK